VENVIPIYEQISLSQPSVFGFVVTY